MSRPLPGIPIEEQPGPIVLRLCLWAEARGESAKGKLAVAWVIKNRAEKSGKSIKEIVLAPLQFSSFNHDDPNRGKMLSAHMDDATGWARCDTVADLIEDGCTLDLTRGATHYFAHDVVHPAWGPPHPGWEGTAVIGGHTFGRAA